MLKKVKGVIIGTQPAGAVISHCLVIAIWKGVVKANNPTMLVENGSLLELTEDSARGVFKSLEWKEWKSMAGIVEPLKQFLEEEKITFQKKILSLVIEHSIRKQLTYT